MDRRNSEANSSYMFISNLLSRHDSLVLIHLFTQGLHSAGTPGILALDLSGDSGRALTGGVDKNAVVFDKNTEQIVATLKGHSKKVTSVIYHPQEDVAITSSPDSTIRIWSIETSSSLQTVRVGIIVPLNSSVCTIHLQVCDDNVFL